MNCFSIRISMKVDVGGGTDQLDGDGCKLEGYLKTIAVLEEETGKLQLRIGYCQTVQQWLSSLFTSCSQPAHTPKSLMSSTSKLTILQKQSIYSCTPKSPKQPISNPTPTPKCLISAHLHYILSQNKDKDRKSHIEQLIKTREGLYAKIGDNLAKEEPYLHEKIMRKIRRQVKKEVKEATIKELQRLCKEKQQWLAETKSQVQEKIDQKSIQLKLTSNLLKMKQIMNRKIVTNQFIQDLAGNQANIDRNVNKLVTIAREVKGKIKGELQKMKEDAVERELRDRDRERRVRGDYVEFDEGLGEEIKELMEEGQRILMEPLGSQRTRQLYEECERLNAELNSLLTQKY